MPWNSWLFHNCRDISEGDAVLDCKQKRTLDRSFPFIFLSAFALKAQAVGIADVSIRSGFLKDDRQRRRGVVHVVVRSGPNRLAHAVPIAVVGKPARNRAARHGHKAVRRVIAEPEIARVNALGGVSVCSRFQRVEKVYWTA